MPVTTRAAALRSQVAGDANVSLDQATLASTSMLSTSTNKITRKGRSKQKHKQLKIHPATACSKPEECSTSQQQITVSKTGSAFEVTNHSDHEDGYLAKETDVSLETWSSNQQVILSPSNEKQIIEQRTHKETVSCNSPNRESTFSSPQSVRSTSTSVTKSPTRQTENDHPIVSLESSSNDENDIYAGDSNAFMNVPVIKGDITTGNSSRGGKMIFMNGCGYLYMSTAKETIGWRCVKRNDNCKAVIHILKRTGEFSHWNGVFHSHVVDSNETRKREILAKIKSRVLDEFISVKGIVEDEYRKANLSTEEKRAMPLPSKIESGLHKVRRRALPPIPRDQKFTVPSVYQETYSNENFLIYDKRKSDYGGRLMMFASNEQLDVLFHSDILFADGTFKVSPTLFDQLYVLLGMQHGEAVPVCFILTSNRRHQTYEAVFRCLKKIASKKGVDFKPTTIICDFEQAFMNAVTKELAETFVTGCWFHFTQSCYRNIQALGLMNIYETDIESRHLLRTFMALALLPIDSICDAFEILKEKSQLLLKQNVLQTFVLYFQKEWIDHFKPSMWSVSNSTWRTNNFAEAQNRRFFARVVQPHPNIWRFLQCLKQEESVVSHRMVQTGLGFSSTKPSKSTRASARKSKQIQKLLHLLHSKTRSLTDTIMSLAYLVGEPVGRGKKGKKNKNNISKSDSSCSSSSSSSNLPLDRD